MPNAVLEAMAFGLPIVTTNVGGISSVFENQKNGMLINDYNKNEIVKYTDSLLADSKLYRGISERNYLDSKNKFWSDKVSERIIKIFNNVKQAR
jgi:glycosyltransferase involved in cell wall biosynthesis